MNLSKESDVQFEYLLGCITSALRTIDSVPVVILEEFDVLLDYTANNHNITDVFITKK